VGDGPTHRRGRGQVAVVAAKGFLGRQRMHVPLASRAGKVKRCATHTLLLAVLASQYSLKSSLCMRPPFLPQLDQMLKDHDTALMVGVGACSKGCPGSC